VASFAASAEGMRLCEALLRGSKSNKLRRVVLLLIEDMAHHP